MTIKKISVREADRLYGKSPLSTRKAAAHKLKVHETTIDRMINRGLLQKVKVAGRTHVTVASIEAVLAAEVDC
jgi:hypothetical protein